MAAYSFVMNVFNDITRDSTRRHFSQAQVDRYANRALQEICERTRHLDAQETINAVSGTMEYATTSDGYDIYRVEYDGEVLIPVNRDFLRRGTVDYSSQTGTPKFYYLDEVNESTGYQVLGIVPSPGSSLTNGIRVWSHPFPADVDGDALTTDVEIPDWAIGSVIFYMLKIAYTAESQVQDLKAVPMFDLLYEDSLDRLVMRSRSKQPKKWASGGPGGPVAGLLGRLPDRITE